jgi:hypothetical protein
VSTPPSLYTGLCLPSAAQASCLMASALRSNTDGSFLVSPTHEQPSQKTRQCIASVWHSAKWKLTDRCRADAPSFAC